MADFVVVAHLAQLPPGRGMTVTVRGFAVALFNVAGTVYALADTCRHAGSAAGCPQALSQITENRKVETRKSLVF
jgi:nitrite reductase/ring-hydroxylating ferredoxin subunit